MKRFLTALLASCAVVFAIPPTAIAQNYRPAPGYNNADDWRGRSDYRALRTQFQGLNRGIWQAAGEGRFTPWQARRLSSEVGMLVQRLSVYYRNDGLSPWERQDLQRGVARLHAHIQQASSNGRQEYGYGYGRDGYDPRLQQ